MRLLVAAATMPVGGMAGYAQQGGRQGQAAPAPNQLGQPMLDPSGFPRDEVMLKASSLAPEDRKYADLEVAASGSSSWRWTRSR